MVIDVPDTTGPAITSRPALPTFTSAPTISWTVGATDPGPAGAGVASYDAVVCTGPVGGALGAATSPAGWTGAPTPTFTLPVSTGQRYCLSARATEKAGNVGAYSSSRLGLVATKCPTCGVVGVYVGSTLLAKVNLASSRTSYKVMIALPRVSLRTTKVTVRVLTSGKSVQIDGLHTSRV